jgi:putative solute:sodium symporter small subunit
VPFRVNSNFAVSKGQQSAARSAVILRDIGTKSVAAKAAEMAKASHVEEMTFMASDNNAKAYWSATLGLLTKVLIIWALCSYGAGILFAPMLNGIHLGGYPLGFWFAQQGSIYIFIVLIFYYAVKMGQIDRKFGMDE